MHEVRYYLFVPWGILCGSEEKKGTVKIALVNPGILIPTQGGPTDLLYFGTLYVEVSTYSTLICPYAARCINEHPHHEHVMSSAVASSPQ